MNIITICTPDWVNTQLARFVRLTGSAMPGSSIRVIIPVAADMPDVHALRKLRANLLGRLQQVEFVKLTAVPGRLAYFDWLRGQALAVLGISEGMYLDPDIDVREDISDFPTVAPEARCILTPDLLTLPGVREGLAAYGYNLDDLGHPVASIGAMYLRQDFGDEVLNILNSGKINMRSPVPGTVAWNILVAKYKFHMLPFGYHAHYKFDVANIPCSKLLHFAGDTKTIRPYIRYDGGNIVIQREPITEEPFI